METNANNLMLTRTPGGGYVNQSWTSLRTSGNAPYDTEHGHFSPKVKQQQGFTLIELMAVIVVLIVMLTVAVPGYQSLILNNRSLGESYSLHAALSNARSEAMTRRAPVVVCPTNNGVTCDTTLPNWFSGYMSFVDTNDDFAPDPNDPDEEIIQYVLGVDAMLAFDNASNVVRFDPRGYALSSQGTFTLCDRRGANKARALILNPVGSVRGALDTDGDDIVNDDGGVNIGC